MRILHVVSVKDSKANGVAVAVREYLKYEKKYCDVALFSLNSSIYPKEVEEYSILDYSNIAALPNGFSQPDLVVFNEVYKPQYIKLYKECVKKGIKYIIIPHGCLVSEDQKRHRLKKIIGNMFLFNKFIRRANAIQFLNETEEQKTNFKYKKSIIHGNGLEMTIGKNLGAESKTIVFIGRYDIKVKGLDLLCKMCKKYHSWFVKKGFVFNLYGAGTPKNLKELNKLVNKYNISDILHVNNAVYGDEKNDVLINAYAFIQCSRHEGQPMGIIEALANGVPCIVTYETTLGHYINETNSGRGCGFSVDKVYESVKFLINNINFRNECSINARTNAMRDFEICKVIADTLKDYEVIINDF